MVAMTSALFSWGYIRIRAAHGGPWKEQNYYALFNLFVMSLVAVPVLANVALMWVAVELTTLLSAFLVGFDDTPEALEAAWKYVILTTLGAVLALLGFLILYWGSRVAGDAPFTWAGLVGGRAAHAAGAAMDRLPSHSRRLRHQGRAWCPCILGCRTRTAKRRPRSAHCSPESKRRRCSMSSFGCFRWSAACPHSMRARGTSASACCRSASPRCS